MKNIIKNNGYVGFSKQILASAVIGVTTTVIMSSVAQASDIELYQAARSGDVTLMFMLDISGSMSRYNGDTSGYGCDLPAGVTDRGRNRANEQPIAGGPTYLRAWCRGSNGINYYDRITRLKDGMMDLLFGNAAAGITRISNDKIIGLSTLGAYANSSNRDTGAVLVPARRLDAIVGGKTQRQILIDTIGSFNNWTNTPTARSYAETVAYLFGTSTVPTNLKVYFVRSNNSYATCSSWNSAGDCTSNWNGWYSGFSNNGNYRIGPSATLSGQAGNYYLGPDPNNATSGFQYSSAETKVSNRSAYSSPESLDQGTDEVKKCSGQGIYVLTDGEPSQDTNSLALMKNALGSFGSNFTCNGTSWDCITKLNSALLNPNSNPKGLKFKTAVVGFGNAFNNVTSYDRSKTQEENVAALGPINTDVKNAALWGILGEGGWYSGSSSLDIVNSVNQFINGLGTDIPPVSTGSPTIPLDALYPAELQNFAYYPQFDPTPDKSYQLWAGNLKKYAVSSDGFLVDKSGNSIVETTGKIKQNLDLWAHPISSEDSIKNADETMIGSSKRAYMGGVKSKLLLNFAQNSTVENRNLLTNRVGTTGGTTFTGGTTLRQVKASDLSHAIYKNDPHRGYLLTLLGFSGLDVNNPNNITSSMLTNAPELRQVGGVMHSSPILLTNKGSIVSQNNIIVTENREDYVLFGTTQGLLHVVDAETGREKFAFVPHEMVEKQKEAFLKYDSTSGGMNHLYYGIDAPWTAYTEYVVGSNRILTVGSGLNSQEGIQMVYGGLRMGGRSYYALNLQNMNSPKIAFHIDPENNRVHYKNSSKTFNQLQYMGQSWSKPQIVWVRWNGQRKRVMFVGGGYDSGYESDEYHQTNARGAGVYMFDADNGDLLWWSSKNASDTTSGVIGVNQNDMKYSVVSEIRSVDADADGLVDNLYFGDLGGQLWRVDINNNATQNSDFTRKPVRILNLNKGALSPRFYDMPAFSIYSNNGSKFAVISIGSGNRSQPLAEYTFSVTSYDYDAIYNVYDKDVAKNDLITETVYLTQNIKTSGNGALVEINNTNRLIESDYLAPVDSSNGWYYKFKSNKVQTAKVMGTPLVMNRRMYVAYFDASKPGLSGDCGAGVKGESFLSTFCMPFGQCKVTEGQSVNDSIDDIPLGAGIQTPTAGSDCKPGEDCSKKQTCPTDDPTCSETNDEKKSDCISAGTRTLITPQGGAGGVQTEVCLTTLKWYEKLK